MAEKNRLPRISSTIYNKKNTIDYKLMIIIIPIIILTITILKWAITNKRNSDILSKLINENANSITVNFNDEELSVMKINFNNMNEKVKAWISINNTNINYPVVQTDNNSYYLEHNINNEISNGGWIFADYRNNLDILDRNTIIYGHNMKNNSMFADLSKMLKTSAFKETKNKYINFNTVHEKYIGEIVSVYKILAEDFVVRNYFSDKEFIEYINDIKEKSIYKFNTKVSTEDKLITLYTCDDNNKNRIIVQAKLIKIDY